MNNLKYIASVLILFSCCSAISFAILLGPAYILARLEIPAWIVIIFLVIYVLTIGYLIERFKITEKIYWAPRRRLKHYFHPDKDQV